LRVTRRNNPGVYGRITPRDFVSKASRHVGVNQRFLHLQLLFHRSLPVHLYRVGRERNDLHKHFNGKTALVRGGKSSCQPLDFPLGGK
jgi:hypothetical protein